MTSFIAATIFLATFRMSNELAPLLRSSRARVTVSGSRIVGGKEVEPNSVPYQVGLNINRRSFCGGALISGNFVLTAAHCIALDSHPNICITLFVNRALSIDVILGAHNLSKSEEENRVVVEGVDKTVHPDFDSSTFNNDIGLIKLATPANLNRFVQPIALPPRQGIGRNYLNELSVATGWGLHQDVANPSLAHLSEVLLSVEVNVTRLDECALYYNRENAIYVTDANICTSGYRNRGTCSGDSGGPLVSNGMLIGLTSFKMSRCEFCSQSVYTNVGWYIDWIVANSDVEGT